MENLLKYQPPSPHYHHLVLGGYTLYLTRYHNYNKKETRTKYTGLVASTNAKLHSTKFELRFCALYYQLTEAWVTSFIK